MFANYRYSLTGAEQSAIQLWLRLNISAEGQESDVWQLLHSLTYPDSWTDTPEFNSVEMGKTV